MSDAIHIPSICAFTTNTGATLAFSSCRLHSSVISGRGFSLKYVTSRFFTQSLINSNFRSELVWDFTQRRNVVSGRSLGTTYRSHLQGSSSFCDSTLSEIA